MDQRDWNWCTDYRYWGGIPNWGRNPGPPIPTNGKCNFDKWGDRNPRGRTPRADPGCKVCQYIDWALKTNGGSLAKDMPLLSEFT